jgi:hypothetical protein
MQSSPFSVMGITLNAMSRRAARSCQGTMLEWCSIAVKDHFVAGFHAGSVKEEAIRLMASVVPRVK